MHSDKAHITLTSDFLKPGLALLESYCLYCFDQYILWFLWLGIKFVGFIHTAVNSCRFSFSLLYNIPSWNHMHLFICSCLIRPSFWLGSQRLHTLKVLYFIFSHQSKQEMGKENLRCWSQYTGQLIVFSEKFVRLGFTYWLCNITSLILGRSEHLWPSLSSSGKLDTAVSVI